MFENSIMNLIDDYIPHITDSKTLEKILRALNYDPSMCKENKSIKHLACYQYDNQLPIPLCSYSLIYLIINLLACNPTVLEESCQCLISEHFRKQAKLPGIINMANLSILRKSETQTLTWIKFESLLIRLIKDKVYEPICMSNEILAIAKSELPMDLRGKLASLVKSCVSHCQKVIDTNEEEQNKWCEILDWMSWFMADEPIDYN